MSDLDKLMAKMNNNKKSVEQPAPVEKVAPAPALAPVPEPEIMDDTDDTDEENIEQEQPIAEEVEQVPAKQEDDQHSIGQEIAVLQNVGVFRREMILIEKEKIDVLKVMAQTLLDIKKKLLGEENAKE